VCIIGWAGVDTRLGADFVEEPILQRGDLRRRHVGIERRDGEQAKLRTARLREEGHRRAADCKIVQRMSRFGLPEVEISGTRQCGMPFLHHDGFAGVIGARHDHTMRFCHFFLPFKE
jgi:hypothetical protein